MWYKPKQKLQKKKRQTHFHHNTVLHYFTFNLKQQFLMIQALFFISISVQCIHMPV